MFALRCTLRTVPLCSPPDATTGLEGIELADSMLRDYGAPGLLIGGLAKEIWSGTADRDVLDSHKDVDVLVLSPNCRQHPRQWEGGIDWWVSHNLYERPSNGTKTGLLWTAESLGYLEPGLYLCPLPILREVIRLEQAITERWDERRYCFCDRPNTFGVISRLAEDEVFWWEHRANTRPARYCKSR